MIEPLPVPSPIAAPNIESTPCEHIDRTVMPFFLSHLSPSCRPFARRTAFRSMWNASAYEREWLTPMYVLPPVTDAKKAKVASETHVHDM